MQVQGSSQLSVPESALRVAVAAPADPVRAPPETGHLWSIKRVVLAALNIGAIMATRALDLALCKESSFSLSR